MVGQHQNGLACAGHLNGAKGDTVRDNITAVFMLDHRALHAAAHAVKLLGDGVFAAQKIRKALFGKGIVLRAQDHAQRVYGAGAEFGRDKALANVAKGGHGGFQLEHIALLQLAALQAAQSGLHVGGLAAHHLGQVKAACHGNVGAAAGFGGTEAQGLPGFYLHSGIAGNGLAVQTGAQITAGDGDHFVALKAQLGAHQRAFQHTHAGIVAHKNVCHSSRVRVTRARNRHAELLVAPAALILHGGKQAGIQNGDAHIIRPPFGDSLHTGRCRPRPDGKFRQTRPDPQRGT